METCKHGQNGLLTCPWCELEALKLLNCDGSDGDDEKIAALGAIADEAGLRRWYEGRIAELMRENLLLRLENYRLRNYEN